MKNKIKVAYLLDNTNSWIRNYLKKSGLIRINKKYNSKIFTNHSKIKNYDIVFIINYTKGVGLSYTYE